MPGLTRHPAVAVSRRRAVRHGMAVSPRQAGPSSAKTRGRAGRWRIPRMFRLRRTRTSNDPGIDPHPRRQAAQPQEPRPRPAHRRADGGHRPQRLGQVQPGLRHPLCRGTAALCRDVLGLCAPVPGPHGQAGRRPGRRRAAGHRHRPDQSGALLAFHGRHDDRAERPPEAAAGAGGRPVRPQDGAARAARHAGDDVRRADGAHQGQRSAAGGDVPGRAAGEHDARGTRAVAGRERLHARAGRARGGHAHRPAQGARRGRRPLPHPGRGEGACDRGDRGGAQARGGTDGGVCPATGWSSPRRWGPSGRSSPGRRGPNGWSSPRRRGPRAFSSCRGGSPGFPPSRE